MQPQIANETFSFTFTTRETYIAWRAAWREEYAELSAQIRKGRALIIQIGKEISAANAKLDMPEMDNLVLRMARIQTQLRNDRADAGRMMRQRQAATAFKNAQLAASKQAA